MKHPFVSKRGLMSMLIVGACLLSFYTAAAQAQSDEWRVDFNSWLWMYGISGDVGLGPVTVDVDSSFIDILQESDSIMAFSGRLEIGQGKFAGFIDGTYAKVGADDQSGPAGLAKVDVTVEMGMVDFGLMYRLGDWDFPESDRNQTLDVYAGARYLSLGVELDPASAASRDRDKDWIDPIIGLKLTQPLSSQWYLNLWGDIGGFGANSDLTWSVTGVVGYDFKLFDMPATIYGGYRAIGWDYDDGSGRNRFEWDAVLHGPTLGLQIKF